jgi:hypothetical protein
MSTKCDRGMFVIVLAGLAMPSDGAVAQVARGNCAGLALVRPQGGLYGTIYMRDQQDKLGRHGRAGYLPSGMVVTIENPTTNAAEIADGTCAFHYRNAVRGHIDRGDLFPLTKTLAAAGVNASEIQGFVSPADPEKRLNLYRSDQVSPDEVIADFGRNDRAVILLTTKNAAGAGDALEVQYVVDATVDKPKLARGYVRAKDDRCCGEGEDTFRIFRPLISKADANLPPPKDRGAWWDRLVNWASTTFKGKIREVLIASKEELFKLGNCEVKTSIKLDLSVEGGVGTSAMGVHATGKSEVEWEKASGKVVQFTSIGQRDDLKLSIAGIATCSESNVAYLEHAHIIVGDPTETNRDFSVGRGEFFRVISENEALKKLEDDSESINLNLDPNRELAQLIIIPRKDGKNSSFYYSLFDQLERYWFKKVLLPLKERGFSVEEDDRFAVMLLTAEALAWWQPRPR